MIPKNTATTVSLPPEKPSLPSAQEKSSAVVYIDSPYTAEQDSPVRVKRATICACAVVLTTLILVAGTLGAITIILTYTSGGQSGTEPPTRDSQHFGKSPMLPEFAETKPRIKIDDGGLWPPKPMTPDIVTASTGKDGDIHFEEVGNNKDGTGDDNGILVIGQDGPNSGEVLEQASESSLSASSGTESSSDDYERGRTYISSSFPYDGFYMRGGVGSPPRAESSDMGGSEGVSGDESVSGDGGDWKEEEGDEQSGSGLTEAVFRSSSSYRSEPDPYDRSWDMYYIP